jgi:PKD repeat protein
VSYAWDFDNDGAVDATTATASFTYTTQEVYTATLTVTDTGGLTDTDTVQIEVTGEPAGSIIVDAEHPAWFKYSGGGGFYMCGPGDPEGFLYRGSRNPDGTRNGDQTSLINKVAGTGANCIYMMAVRSHGGDGGSTENPWIGSNPNNGIDHDILNQWETWFTAMDNYGITIFLVFYDDSAAPFGRDLISGQLDAREANLIDEVVNAFKHHKHLIWCVAEEYGEALSNAHVSKVAERIKQQDDNNHPVAVHQNSGTSFDFNGNANLDQFAVQYNTDSTSALHNAAVAAWNNVGGLKNINLAEFQPQPTGSNLRQKVWAIAMGGAYSMILFMDIASTSTSDLQICGRIVNFFEATRFNECVPADALKRNDTDYVLASPGKVYIAYADGGSSLGVNVQAGNYAVTWYDPADGDWVDGGVQALAAGDHSFARPGAIGAEAVLYLAATAAPPTISQHPQSQMVAAGATVTFTVVATGEGTLTYRWQKNGANLSNGGRISGAVSSTLQIIGVLPDDAANYRCVVGNSGGDTPSDEAALTVTSGGEGEGEGAVEGEGHPEGVVEGEGVAEGEGVTEGVVEGVVEGEGVGEGEG